MKRFLKVFISLIILFFNDIYADDYPEDISIQFHNIGLEKGLSNSTIYEIIQDRKGYLWIGTQNGLNKYDGYTFKTFKTIPFDTLSLANNWIQAIHETKDGNIWIGTFNGGLSRLDPVTGKFTNYESLESNPSSIYNNRIWKIYEDSNSNLWIGTSGSLDMYNPQSNNFKHFLNKELNSFPNGAANSITEDNDGFIWVATWGAGLFKIDMSGDVIKQYLFSNNGKMTSNKLKVVFIDSDDNLWIGTNQDGLIKFNKDSEEYSFYSHVENDPSTLSHNFVLSIHEDRNKNLWIGTHSGGLNLFNRVTGKFTIFQNNLSDDYSLSNNWVSAICESKSGIIWLGTDKGISKFLLGKQIFHNLRHREWDQTSLSSDDIHSVIEDSKGLLWIGTWRKGLNVYNPKTRQIKTYFYEPNNKNSIPDNTIFALHEDKHGDIWIGTYNGLAKYLHNTDNFLVFRNDPENHHSLGFNNVTSIADDSFGNLWIGTWNGGLHKMNPKTQTFKAYQKNQNNANGLSDMVINCIFEDTNKNLYIGTSSGGLNIYDRVHDSFRFFVNDPNDHTSISNNSISSITEGSNGEIWIGTLGGGLNKFDPKSMIFSHVNTIAELSDNSIMSIQPDGAGNIWFSTSNNLVYFDTKNNNIFVYDNEDGITNQQFAIASDRGQDGKFIFGGKNGITYFYPTSLLSPITKPNIEILSVKVLGNDFEIQLDENLYEIVQLSYTQNDIAINFAVLDYFRPDKIKYRYILEGYQTEWIVSNIQRTAYFTNLDPGNYKFKLLASFENNNWYDRDKYLSIIIHPPFWERWWFILISLLIISALIYLAYWYRMNQLLKIEKLRTSIASDLHDEIASNLSGIAMFGKIIQGERTKMNSSQISSEHLLDRIILLSQESIISIREIIWAIDTKIETIYDLLLKINDMIITSCHAKNIEFIFDIPSKELLPAKNLSPNVRKELWMFLKEVLNNAIKHSDCTELHLITTFDGQLIRIVIKDNGKGFDTTANYSGKGLSTITKRARSLKAELEINSELKAGTTIIFSVKV